MAALYCFFFVKLKTAYEMRISDWSSDVCSSDHLRLFARLDFLRVQNAQEQNPGQLRHVLQSTSAVRAAHHIADTFDKTGERLRGSNGFRLFPDCLLSNHDYTSKACASMRPGRRLMSSHAALIEFSIASFSVSC